MYNTNYGVFRPDMYILTCSHMVVKELSAPPSAVLSSPWAVLSSSSSSSPSKIFTHTQDAPASFTLECLYGITCLFTCFAWCRKSRSHSSSRSNRGRSKLMRRAREPKLIIDNRPERVADPWETSWSRIARSWLCIFSWRHLPGRHVPQQDQGEKDRLPGRSFCVSPLLHRSYWGDWAVISQYSQLPF